MWLLSLLFVVVLAACGFGLVGYGFGAVADGMAGLREPPAVLRGIAALAGACAVVVYAWGLLHVVGALLEAEDGGTDSAPVRSCRTPGWEARDISGYHVSFVPLGFVCETGDGGTYDNGDVPGYVNPAAAVFALAGAGGAVTAGYASERRARSTQGPGDVQL